MAELPPDLQPGRTLNLLEVAHLLGISDRTLWRWITKGKFSRPAYDNSGAVVFYETDVLVYRYRVLRGDFNPTPPPKAPPDPAEED